MALCAFNGLKQGLDSACEALDLGRKHSEGGKLMAKASSGFAFGEREAFADYNKQDVLLTWKLGEALGWKWWGAEYAYWLDTWRMNDLGWRVNLPLVKRIAELREDIVKWGEKETLDITDGELNSPKSQKLPLWVKEKYDRNVKSFDAASRKELMKQAHLLPEGLRRLLEVKEVCSEAATAKAKTILTRLAGDRVYGEFIYCGASNTNRAISKGVQLQNLLRVAGVSDEDVENKLAEPYNFDGTNIKAIKAQLDSYKPFIRSCFTADAGEQLYILDFTGIEMRLVMWYAEEAEVLDSVRDGLDPYVEFAKKMFNNPNLTKADKFLRDQAKVAMLGCGFGLGWPSLKMDAKKKFGLTLTDEDSKNLVKGYRKTYAKVPQLWDNMEKAFILTILNKKGCVAKKHGTRPVSRFEWHEKPKPHIRAFGAHDSPLFYYNPTLTGTAKNRTINAYRHKGKEELYGSKLFENMIQSTARHAFMKAVRLLSGLGMKIVGQIHDEIILTGKNLNTDMLKTIVAQPDSALPGLPIDIEFGVRKYYTKL